VVRAITGVVGAVASVIEAVADEDVVDADRICASSVVVESLSLVLVINDTKLLMPCVKCFELGISNTCDEGVCGKECGHKITKRWCMDMK
jgi:hypothetical protein